MHFYCQICLHFELWYLARLISIFVSLVCAGFFGDIFLGHAVARITVEDCLNHIDNRFELSLAAATRARQLVAGHQPLVEDSKRDKPVVVALREIASGNIDRTILKRIGL